MGAIEKELGEKKLLEMRVKRLEGLTKKVPKAFDKNMKILNENLEVFDSILSRPHKTPAGKIAIAALAVALLNVFIVFLT